MFFFFWQLDTIRLKTCLHLGFTTITEDCINLDGLRILAGRFNVLVYILKKIVPKNLRRPKARILFQLCSQLLWSDLHNLIVNSSKISCHSNLLGQLPVLKMNILDATESFKCYITYNYTTFYIILQIFQIFF